MTADPLEAVVAAHQLSITEDPFYKRNIVCSCGIVPGNPSRHLAAALEAALTPLEAPVSDQRPKVKKLDPRESQIDWTTSGEANASA